VKPGLHFFAFSMDRDEKSLDPNVVIFSDQDDLIFAEIFMTH